MRNRINLARIVILSLVMVISSFFMDYSVLEVRASGTLGSEFPSGAASMNTGNNWVKIGTGDSARKWQVVDVDGSYLYLVADFTFSSGVQLNPSGDSSNLQPGFNTINTEANFEWAVPDATVRPLVINHNWQITNENGSISNTWGDIDPQTITNRLGMLSYQEYQSLNLRLTRNYVAHSSTLNRFRSPVSNNPHVVRALLSSGIVSSNNNVTSYSGVRPAMYLPSSIFVFGGDGSEADPYRIGGSLTQIDIQAIVGITAPVNGIVPVTTITETAQYTGTVSWDPVHDPFQASTAYTATITLTPKAGFTLVGVAENFFTVAGATATNTADTGVITAVFPATGAAPDTTINIAVIPGVTAPVRTATPVTTITETAQYTGTVTWSPTHNPFGASTVYTATITLTPKEGFTLTGVTANFFTVAGATATNLANNGVVTAVFPATGAAPDTTINIAAIPGVTAPVRTATPVTTITETAQYTGTVTWSPTHNPFGASTVYTATITLTPKVGFTLTGVTENFFTVAGATATNTANTGVVTVVFPATGAAPAPPSGNDGGSDDYSPPAPAPTPAPAQPSVTEIIVIVNGQEQNAGKETVIEQDGEKIVELRTDSNTISQKIDKVITSNQANGTNTRNTVEIPVSLQAANQVRSILTGDIVKKMEDNQFTLVVSAERVGYVIPATEIGIDNVANILNVLPSSLQQIEVEVRITYSNEARTNEINDQGRLQRVEVLAQPVEFQLIAKTTDTTGEIQETTINQFNNYVTREIEMPEGVDPSKITTGIVYNADGTFSHVPTSIFSKDNKYYARINSLTNSTYTVIWNPITVSSVENHWSKDIVNDMAARIIITDIEGFAPNTAITRGEFADYIVRALGLYRPMSYKEQQFKDVNSAHRLADSIAISNNYGIILGYPDGTFKPEATISRQEAMTMYARAMDIVKLLEQEINLEAKYTDTADIRGWAYDYVKKTVSAGVFKGRTETTINPLDTFTKAEAATAIRNMLIATELINDRSVIEQP